MTDLLWIQESYVNVTEHYGFGDSDPYETWTDDIGTLYRSLVKEYGGCIGKMGIEHKSGKPDTYPAGWIFSRWEQYEDARPRGSCCYVREGQSGYGTPYSGPHYCPACGKVTKATDIWYKREVWITVYRGDPQQVTRTTLDHPVYALTERKSA
jgi:hypothetical protein